MNIKFKHMLKSIMYTTTANGLSLIITAVLTLVIPKVLDNELSYGYWQLYLLYLGYIGFMHFGWDDGVYLRYGGTEYGKLPKSRMATQFWMLSALQGIIGTIIMAAALLLVQDDYEKKIIVMVGILLIVNNLKTYFLYLFEATNRIKEYAKYTRLDRYLFFIGALIGFGLQIKDFYFYILVDVVSRTIALLFCIRESKDIVFCKLEGFAPGFEEAKKNIFAGCKLMFANIASILIIGIVRYCIVLEWGKIVFGKISFTLSMSNLFILFINAVAVVMFPMLRQTAEERLPFIYKTMRTTLMVLLFGMLLAYYPIRLIIGLWLPKYKDALVFLPILFPICIYESKVSILINTYLKTLRKENWILLVNVITVAASGVVTVIAVFVYGNFTISVCSVLFLLAFRCIFSEILLTKQLKIDVLKDTLLEILLTMGFVLSGWFINNWLCMLIYGVMYVCYLLYKRREILGTIDTFKGLLHLKKKVVSTDENNN